MDVEPGVFTVAVMVPDPGAEVIGMLEPACR